MTNELKDLFTHCVYHHIYKKLLHNVYENCKACRREKILHLRPLYEHNCNKYLTNFWLAYVEFGQNCIQEMTKRESCFLEISIEFSEWLEEKSSWEPYLMCIKFDQKAYFNEFSIKESESIKRLEDRIAMAKHNAIDGCSVVF